MDLQWSSCLVYIHNMVVPGQNFKEHLYNLKLALISWTQIANLPKKIRLYISGHVIQWMGYSYTTLRINSNLAEPQTHRGVRHFSGDCKLVAMENPPFLIFGMSLVGLDYVYGECCNLNSNRSKRSKGCHLFGSEFTQMYMQSDWSVTWTIPHNLFKNNYMQLCLCKLGNTRWCYLDIWNIWVYRYW